MGVYLSLVCLGWACCLGGCTVTRWVCKYALRLEVWVLWFVCLFFVGVFCAGQLLSCVSFVCLVQYLYRCVL